MVEIPVGPVFSMVQNTIYALPAVKCTLFTDGVAPTLQQSTTAAFTANVVMPLVNGQADVAGAFIRQTNLATCNVVLKRA